MSTPTKKILTFLALTFALSAVPYTIIISAGALQSAPVLLLMFCPGLAGIITQLVFERSLRGMGWKISGGRYLLIAILIPLAYVSISYAIIWLTGLGRLDPTALLADTAKMLPGIKSSAGLLAAYLGIILTVGVLEGVISAAGEEIGWRGVLVPELAKVSTFTQTALISGAIWAVWHYPALLFGGYNNPGAPVWFGLICFTVMVISAGFISAWLRLKTGSIWPSILLHAMHNLFIQNVFTPLTANTGPTPYFIDEFGVMLALTALIVAWYFWRRRGELAPASPREPAQMPSSAPSGAA